MLTNLKKTKVKGGKPKLNKTKQKLKNEKIIKGKIRRKGNRKGEALIGNLFGN